jgi:hypothetical protein
MQGGKGACGLSHLGSGMCWCLGCRQGEGANSGEDKRVTLLPTWCLNPSQRLKSGILAPSNIPSLSKACLAQTSAPGQPGVAGGWDEVAALVSEGKVE